jgi:flavin-dependent dehydrogenase
LRTHAPSLSVTLIESSSYDSPRIGEVLPAVARTFLDHLGIWEAFQGERFQTAHSTSSIWGQPFRSENHFIYSLQGAGWNLDRARFDAFMAERAEARDVEVRLATRVAAIESSRNGWHLDLSDGSEIRSRFVVDATGRRAAFARRVGANTVALDHLAGFARFFSIGNDAEAGTLIEAFPDGWWYTALNGNSRIVVCMTDVDIARELGLRDKDRWMKQLSEVSWIRRSIAGAALHGSLMICAANSVYLDPVCSTNWLAVGDAACAFDPLSSQGIVKALRAGIFASYAISDFLCKADTSGLVRYEHFIRREFSRYLIVHAQYCGMERRWPDSPFWSRRAMTVS